MRLKILPLLIVSVLCALQGCEKSSVVDTGEFELYYMGASGLNPGDQVNLTPSYIGPAPTDFLIFSITRDGEIFYNPKLDGALTEESSFFIDGESGAFTLQKTSSFKGGKYLVGISCKAGGKEYKYPEAIVIDIAKQ